MRKTMFSLQSGTRKCEVTMLAFGAMLAVLCVSCARACGGSAVDNTIADTGTPLFPAEHESDPAHNTGESRLSVLKSSGNNIITNFRFEKGARNYWHVHPGASENAPCDCLTISEKNKNEHVVWFELVTDEKFKR